MAIVLVAVSLALVSCSGDSSQDYYGSVADMIETYAVELDGLPVASTESSLDDVRAYFGGIDDALGRALTTLDELTAPEDLEIAHPVFVESMMRFADLAGRVSARADAMQTRQDLFDLANDREFGVASFNLAEAQMFAACLQIQAAADAEGSGVELGCLGLTDE